MKKLFRLKFEVIGLVVSAIAVVISYSMYLDLGGDWRIKVLMYFCGTLLLISILGFNTIKAFRKDILKRW